MPTLYYQASQNSVMPLDSDIMAAIDGFSQLDYEINPYSVLSIPSTYGDFHPGPEDVVVGSFQAMSRHFRALNVLPESIDYPTSIKNSTAGRFNRLITLRKAVTMLKNGLGKLFVKPYHTKSDLLLPKVYDGEELEKICNSENEDSQVWLCFPAFEIKSEYRVFVYDNVIQDIRKYKGDINFYPVNSKIELMVNEFSVDAPIAYALDVAIRNVNNTSLVEVNDFWAVGSYGLEPLIYAKMLKARYQQIISSAQL